MTEYRARLAEERRSTRQRGIPADTLERIRKARADGLSWKECVARFGYSQSTMWKAMHAGATPVPHPAHNTNRVEIAAFSHPVPSEYDHGGSYSGSIKGAA